MRCASKGWRARQPGPVDARVIKALSHPLRTRILQALSESVASPIGLARALGEPLGNVSYHVHVLLASGLIELTGTRSRRGATLERALRIEGEAAHRRAAKGDAPARRGEIGLLLFERG
jgi:DNA-binding transcriptional ArsR family regulator